MDVDLNDYFRSDSSARKIAERLMTGEPCHRQDLVADLGVSITSVNRVVAGLERAGVIITRGLAGRHAVFRVTGTGLPQMRRTFPALGDEAEVVATSLLADVMMLEFTSGRCTYRGAAQRGLKPSVQPPLGKAVVVGLRLQEPDRAEVQLRNGRRLILVSAVQNVTR